MSTKTAYVPTPPCVADFMATSAFGVDHPTSEQTVLYPGLGTGCLYDAIHCSCTTGDDYIPRFDYDPLTAIDYEIDPDLVDEF